MTSSVYSHSSSPVFDPMDIESNGKFSIDSAYQFLKKIDEREFGCFSDLTKAKLVAEKVLFALNMGYSKRLENQTATIQTRDEYYVALSLFEKICGKKTNAKVIKKKIELTLNQFDGIKTVCRNIDDFIGSPTHLSEKDLIDIAKMIASHQFRADEKEANISAIISKFKIKDQQALLDIAYININKGCFSSFYTHLDEYSFSKEAFEFLVSKLLQTDLRGIFLDFIPSLHKLNQEAKISLARDLIRQSDASAKAVARNIEKLNIQDIQIRKEIAELLSEKFSISPFIANFHMDDQEWLKDMAVKELNSSAYFRDMQLIDFCKNIHSFGITDQKVLISLARLVANHNNGLISEYIHHFNIQDKDVLIKIFRNELKKGGMPNKSANEYIRNFNFKNQEDLVQLAKESASIRCDYLHEFFQNYNILNENDHLEIYCEILKQSLGMIPSFKKFNLPKTFETFLTDAEDINKFKAMYAKEWPDFSFILDRLKPGVDPTVQTNAFYWLVFTGFMLLKENVKAENKHVWRDIFSSTNLHESCLLSLQFITLFKEPKYKKVYHEITHSDDKPLFHMNKIALLLANQEPSEEMISFVEFIKKEKAFMNPATMGRLILILSKMMVNQTIPKDGFAVLNKYLIDPSKLKENLITLLGIVTNYGPNIFYVMLKVNLLDPLKETYEAVLKYIFKLKNRADFSKVYSETFGQNPLHSLLLAYAGRLGLLTKQVYNSDQTKASWDYFSAMESFKNFLEAILDKKANYRYEFPHVEKLFSMKPGLAEAWTSNTSFDLNQLASQDLDFNFEEFIKAKMNENVLAPQDFPELASYLSSKDESIVEKLKLESMKKARSADEKINLEKVRLQLEIITIIRKGKTGIELLKRLQKRLKTIPNTDQFLNEINGILSRFELVRGELKDLKIVSTDDPITIIKCSDVMRSCQKFDGDPFKNKCLLNYMVDGKCRMFAILDKNENVLARCVVRLLIDQETNLPVILQEPIYYAHTISPVLKDVMDTFAVNEARRLGVSLFRFDGKEHSETSKLISPGSNTKWEYVDSARGMFLFGNYVVTKARKIYSHTS